MTENSKDPTNAESNETKEELKSDNKNKKQLLEEKLQNANFFESRKPKKQKGISSKQNTIITEKKEEKESEAKPSKPGQARKVKVYLIDPERFVIEWCTPKKIGKPLPLYYDIVINNNTFKKVVTQYKVFPNSNKNKNKKNKNNNNNKRPHTFRILVYNCDCDELYKIGIDTYNDVIKGKQTTLYNIKTIIKPSVITDLQMINGKITFKPPIYKSFGNIKYELIDANDTQEKTIVSMDNNNLLFDINEFYKDKKDIKLEDCQWRIRIKETQYENCSFSPIIAYNIGEVKCAKFTACKIFSGDLNTFKTKGIKYPKWEPPPKPDILKDIKQIKLIDKGSYLLVPSNLDPIKNNNVLTVICFSDTHTKHKSFRFDILPPAHLVIHAGDFTFDGNKGEVKAFEQWGKFLASLSIDESKNKELYSNYYNDNDNENELKQEEKYNVLPINERKYKHLICIAGNHEMTFDLEWYNEQGSNAKRYHKLIIPPVNALEIKNIIQSSKYWKYLEDELINVFGLNIYGSPWQPYFFNWAFQKNRGNELKNKWKLIPKETDILITHGPPYCHGDKVALDRVKSTGDNREYFGDKMLMNRVKEIKNIKYHIFGHIHAGTGCSIQNGIDTMFVNAASLNEAYHPRDKPIVFYIEAPTTIKGIKSLV